MSWFRSVAKSPSFHSISFPNEWESGALLPHLALLTGFHSISFPNEWERFLTQDEIEVAQEVSIQLVFPTSGKAMSFVEDNQLMFPFN